MTKTCSCCKLEKSTVEFTSYKRNKDGLQSYCKPCKASKLRGYRKGKEITEEERQRKKEYDKEYNRNNKDKKRQQGKEYRLKNSEKIKKYKTETKERFRKAKNETDRKYRAKRLAIDPVFKLKATLRHRLCNFFKQKNFKKNKKFVDYIGCTVEQLSLHIESQFKDGMSWENHGKWHIDHIIPLAISKTEDDVYKLSHYTNLQPLWANENLKKGSKI